MAAYRERRRHRALDRACCCVLCATATLRRLRGCRSAEPCPLVWQRAQRAMLAARRQAVHARGLVCA